MSLIHLSFPEGRKLKAKGGAAALENRGRKLFLERARESIFQALQVRWSLSHVLHSAIPEWVQSWTICKQVRAWQCPDSTLFTKQVSASEIQKEHLDAYWARFRWSCISKTAPLDLLFIGKPLRVSKHQNFMAKSGHSNQMSGVSFRLFRFWISSLCEWVIPGSTWGTSILGPADAFLWRGVLSGHPQTSVIYPLFLCDCSGDGPCQSWDGSLWKERASRALLGWLCPDISFL